MNFFLRTLLATTVLVGFQLRTDASQSEALYSIQEPRIKTLYDTCESLPKELILLIARYEDESLWRHRAMASSMAALSDETVAVGLENGTIEIHSLHYVPMVQKVQNSLLMSIPDAHKGPVTFLLPAPRGTLISGSTMRYRDIDHVYIQKNGDEISSLTCCSLDRQDPEPSGCRDERIREWDLKTAKNVREWILDEAFLWCKYLRTRGYFSGYSCWKAGKNITPIWLRVWNITSGKHDAEQLLDRTWGVDLPDHCCTYKQLQEFGVWGCKNGQILIHDKKKQQSYVCSGHTAAVTVLRFGRNQAGELDAESFVSGSEDQTIRVWTTATGKCTRVIETNSGPIRALLFFLSGTILSAGKNSKTTQIHYQ